MHENSKIQPLVLKKLSLAFSEEKSSQCAWLPMKRGLGQHSGDANKQI